MAYRNKSRSSGRCGGDCLICSETLSVSRRSNKIPAEFGTRAVDAFIKICDVLQVPFGEIEKDWEFDNTTDERLPFCASCFSGFHSILKLQQQLINIQNQIDEKIAGIREQIRTTPLNNAIREQDHSRIINFREKALNHTVRTSLNPSTTTSIVPIPSNHTDITISTSFESYEQSTFTSSSASNLLCSTDHGHNNVHHTEEIIKSAEEPNPINFKQDYNNYDNCDYEDDFAGAAAEDEDDNFSSEPENEAGDHHGGSNYNQPTIRQRRAAANNSSSRTYFNQGILATLFPPAIQIRTQNTTQESTRRTETETFSPVFTNADGTMIFEGIVISPVEDGYKCGQCGACVGNDNSPQTLRKAQIHIKGAHLGAYKCHICQRNYASNHILSQHIVSHDFEYFCPTCSKPLKNLKGAMRFHQFTHLNAEEKKAAIAAGYKRRGKELEPTLPCRICGKKFPRQSKLKQHELTHLPRAFRKDYKCQHCDKSFATKMGRTEHIFTKHDRTNARKALCKICGESVLVIEMKSHLNRHSASTCKFCEKTFVSEQVYLVHAEKCGKPQKTQEDHEFECDICNKFFGTQPSLAQHRRSVHKSHWKLQVPIKMVADVSVDNPRDQEILDDLNNEGIQHVNENIYSYQLYQIEKLPSESGGAGYRCCTCLEEFQGDDNISDDKIRTESLEEKVKSHVRSMHMGSFRCNRCTKRFNTAFNAEMHMKTEHFKRKTFHCHICGRSTVTLSTAKLHLWRHKNVWEVEEALNTGEGFPARYSASMMENSLKEMGVELNFKCVLCKKEGFNTTESLYEHRVTEHPDAPVLFSVKRKIDYWNKKEQKNSCGGGGKKKEEFKTLSDDEMDGKIIAKKARIIKRRKIRVLAEEDSSGSEEEDISYWNSEYFKKKPKARRYYSERRVRLRDRSNLKKRIDDNYSEYSELDSSSSDEDKGDESDDFVNEETGYQ